MSEAAQAHPRGDLAREDPTAVQEHAVHAAEEHRPTRSIGAGRGPISVAEVRRCLPVGARIQVFYLGGQREQTEPDVRMVTKQTSYEMVSNPLGSDRDTWPGLVFAWSETPRGSSSSAMAMAPRWSPTSR